MSAIYQSLRGKFEKRQPIRIIVVQINRTFPRWKCSDRRHNNKNTKEPREKNLYFLERENSPYVFSLQTVTQPLVRRRSEIFSSFIQVHIYFFHYFISLYFSDEQQPILFRVLNPRLIAVSAPERKAVSTPIGNGVCLFAHDAKIIRREFSGFSLKLHENVI